MNENKKYKVSGELDLFEMENLVSIISDKITEHRYESKLNHAHGKITDAELVWHLGFADQLELILEKLSFEAQFDV